MGHAGSRLTPALNHKDYRMLKRILPLILLTMALSVNAQTNEVGEKETLELCANLDMYGAFAMRNRDMGMPRDTAFSLISSSMRKNLKLPLDVTEAIVKVVEQIYTQVYADKSINKNNIETIIIATCSRYKGRNVDRQKIAQYLADNPQSAWDPIQRVPLCTKTAQSAANIATARDRGMGKDKISDISEAALANDPATQKRLPFIIEDVFANRDISVANFFAYNLARCNSEREGKPYKGVADLKSEILKCQAKSTRQEQEVCGKALFGL